MIRNHIKWNARHFELAALALMALAPNMAHAAEKKIQRTDLPAAVDKTAQEQSKGATIVGYVQDSEKGKVNYEVEMTVNGHSKDITINKAGQVVEVEEEVALDSLPAQVKQGLMSQAAGAKIVKVESLTKGGKIVGYEASILKGTKKSEVAVTPAGKKASEED